MENNSNLSKNNPTTPSRQTPISNNIEQFLKATPTFKTTPSRPVVKMNKSSSTPTAAVASSPSRTPANKSSSEIKEKKNCKVKKTCIDDDIEMYEEDSDKEQEIIITQPPKPTPQQPSAATGNVDVVIDITEEEDDDDILSAPGGDTPQIDLTKKMQSIKHVLVDDDIEMIEEADSGKEEEDPIPESYNTAETPSELQQIHEAAAAAQDNDNSRVPTPVHESLNFTVERSEDVKSNGEDDSHDGSSSTPAVKSSPRVPRRRTPAPNSRDVQRYKVQPGQYKFGVTNFNKKNKRIIVPLQRDLNLVHEYTHSHNNAWYCRFCRTVLNNKQKFAYAFLNDDGTFDALVDHICEPITSEKSERDQELIKQKFSSNEGSCSSNRSSDFEKSLGDDADYEPEESGTSDRPSRASRSQNVNYREPYNLGDYVNQSGGTSRRDRRSLNNMREVSRSEWEYGYNRDGIKDKRVIVFEPNDRQYAIEYGVYDGYIRCLRCFRIERTTRTARFHRQMENLIVPSNHICAPRLYTEIEEEQKIHAAKYEERSIFSESFASSSGKRPRIDDESMRLDTETPLSVENSDANNGTTWNDFDQPPTPPSRVNSVNQQRPVAASPFTTPSPPLSEQSDSPINDPSTIRFYHPSGFFLNQSCERLGLTYSAEAYVFLANIRIYDFNLNSSPREVHQVINAEMSGFSALSLMLTGSEEFGIQIKCSLNTYILQNCDAIGQLVGHDLSRCNNPKVIQNSSANNPTEIHFVAMAHMLNCRFVIYKNGGYKRYGNWSHSPEYRPLFLLQFANGKYSPILSF